MNRPKILRRMITPVIQASRERDMETVLDNYRENLKNHDVTDENAIERFISEERIKMQREYESLDNGDSSSNIYYTPTNWESIAAEMKGQEIEEEEEMSM